MELSLSHLVCMKPHLAAANSATKERKSCVCCWQAPSSWRDSHTQLLQATAPSSDLQCPSVQQHQQSATDVLLEHHHSHCPSCLQWSCPVSSHDVLLLKLFLKRLKPPKPNKAGGVRYPPHHLVPVAALQQVQLSVMPAKGCRFNCSYTKSPPQ